jgi:hypothetical protein
MLLLSCLLLTQCTTQKRKNFREKLLPAVDVMIFSIPSTLLEDRMSLAAELWAKGIRAEYAREPLGSFCLWGPSHFFSLLCLYFCFPGLEGASCLISSFRFNYPSGMHTLEEMIFQCQWEDVPYVVLVKDRSLHTGVFKVGPPPCSLALVLSFSFSLSLLSLSLSFSFSLFLSLSRCSLLFALIFCSCLGPSRHAKDRV